MLAMGVFVALCGIGTALCVGAFVARETAKCPQPHALAERQLSPHEKENNGPTPARVPVRWNEERYSL